MRQNSRPSETAEQHIKTILRATREKYSTEDKIRIALSGLREEHSIAELCRREEIACGPVTQPARPGILMPLP
jgi:transposase